MKKTVWMFSALLVLLIVTDSFAGTSAAVAEDILQRFNSVTSSWSAPIVAAASRIFWILVTISMVWTFGLMALRRADLGEFFSEFIRYIVFVGFFWWLLTNALPGPGSMNIAGTIISGLQQLGQQAGGITGSALGPEAIIVLGFSVLEDALAASAQLSWHDFGTSFILNATAMAILLVLALIAVNMILVLISAWILLYAGVFFLGFGGSRWTSDIAVNYFKTVLGVGVQLMTMILLASIGHDFIRDLRMSISSIEIMQLATVFIAAIILLVLVNKVPPLLAGVITGSSVGNLGAGGIGAGAAIGAMSTAAGAMLTSAAAMKGLAKEGAGGASAVIAAIKAAGPPSNLSAPMPTPETSGKGGSAFAAFGKGAIGHLSSKIATETTGGRIASAIKNLTPGTDGESSGSLGFYGNSLAGDTSRDADPELEIAAFRDR